MQAKHPALIFSVAAPEDAAWLVQWERHLLLLQRAGYLRLWSERLILPGENRLQQMSRQLDQANLIGGDLAPYRQYIGDIFPGLYTSFTDRDVYGNHLWAVYSASCYPNQPDSGFSRYCKGSAPSGYTPPAASDVWASYSVSGGGQ